MVCKRGPWLFLASGSHNFYRLRFQLTDELTIILHKPQIELMDEHHERGSDARRGHSQRLRHWNSKERGSLQLEVQRYIRSF